jgi:hypothetical protein
MWLSKIRVGETAGALKYDLAIDQSGSANPSIEAAGYTVNGLRPPVLAPRHSSGNPFPAIAAVLVAGLVVLAGLARNRGRSSRVTTANNDERGAR